MSKREFKGESLIQFPEDFIIIDIETTGYFPKYDRIIEVAGIKYRSNIEIDRFSSLVKPYGYSYGDIDEYIESLTGITNDMINNAPDIKDILKEFKTFLGDSILIGHNVNFDINFLYDEFELLLSEKLSNNFLDTLRISRRLHPEQPHHRLEDLCFRYSIPYEKAHRSLNDCLLTARCLFALQSEILNRFGSFEGFYEGISKSFRRSKRSKLMKVSDIKPESDAFDPDNPIFGKVCVFTGTLERMLRKDAMQIVANLGGINAASITKKTNYLILGNNDYCSSIKDGKSNKQKKAEALKLSGQDIEIISEDVFYDMIENN